jgi:hypothetical protein
MISNILIILTKNNKYYIGIRKNETFHYRTVLGYYITLWKSTSEFSASGVYTIYIPIRNAKKIKLEEEIERMMQYSYQNKYQSLNAMFSWLKTEKQVEQFEKDYSVIDRKIVEKLVSDWRSKQNVINY